MQLSVNGEDTSEWGVVREAGREGFFLEMDEMEIGKGYLARLNGVLLLLALKADAEVCFFKVMEANDDLE